VCYGGDLQHISAPTFKQHVLQQDDYDLTRIRFLGPVKPGQLVNVFSASDVHLYLTVPFVLSWSVLNAMSCGCTVLASDTAPVREVVRHGETGLLCDFFDAAKFARMAVEVLREPREFGHLGAAAEAFVRDEYSLATIMPRMIDFYCEVAAQRPGS
jgi:glycosyltransferase involved in cell wall biosynthesis